MDVAQPWTERLQGPLLQAGDRLERRTEGCWDRARNLVNERLSFAYIVLMLQTMQVFALLLLFSVLSLVGSIVGGLLIGLFWIGIAAAIVLLVCHVIVRKSRANLKSSRRCHALFTLIMLSEGILLSYVALVLAPEWMFSEVFIAFVAFAGATVYARKAEAAFTCAKARLVAMGLGAVGTVLMLVLGFGSFIGIVRVTQALLSVLVLLYLWFLFGMLEKVLAEATGEDRFLCAVFAQLIISIERLSWVIAVLKLPVLLYQRCRRNRTQPPPPTV